MHGRAQSEECFDLNCPTKEEITDLQWLEINFSLPVFGKKHTSYNNSQHTYNCYIPKFLSMLNET
jgi:hypothetical protein